MQKSVTMSLSDIIAAFVADVSTGGADNTSTVHASLLRSRQRLQTLATYVL